MENKNQNKRPTLRELFFELERQKAGRYDIVVPSKELKVVYDVGTNKISMDVPQPEAAPKNHGITNYAHHQLADKCGIPWRYYDKMQTEGQLPLLANNVNTWLPNKEKRLVRVLDNNVRAVLSDKYRCIDNYDILLQTLNQFKELQEKNHLTIDVKQNQLTDSHLYIKATSPDLVGEVFHLENRAPEPVHGGIIISNSEVGAGSFKVEPFINVLVCQNGLIREKVFKRVHIGREHSLGYVNWSNKTLELQDAALWAKIGDMITQTFTPELFQKWINEINQIAQTDIPKPTLAIDNIIKHFKLPENKKNALIDQFTRESPTQWGLSMAVTRVAQDEDDYEKQIELEKIGAKILNKEITPLVVKSG